MLMNELGHLDATDGAPGPRDLQDPACDRLDAARIARTKRAYTVRNVPLARMATLLTGDLAPRAGDVVLARVLRLGQHPRLELGTGRRAALHAGDEIVVCFGNRYAPDQFEAEVPECLGECDLVAAGGVAAVVRSRHRTMARATRIQPLGLLADHLGRRLNLADWSIADAAPRGPRPYTLAVVGSSMNAGKTTTAATLIRGLRAHGLRVVAGKATGTGAGGDRWTMLDAGAEEVIDFTDFGLPSTYRLGSIEVEHLFGRIADRLAAEAPDVCVIEIADGLLQAETGPLLRSAMFRDRVDAVLYAAADALGAIHGVQWLRDAGLPVTAATGLMTSSTLASREAAAHLPIPVVPTSALAGRAWWTDELVRLHARRDGGPVSEPSDADASGTASGPAEA